MNTKLHFSSEKNDWETPQWLFDELDKEFEFELDVCASRENQKIAFYFTERQDSLNIDWKSELDQSIIKTYNCWMNPPYGRKIGKWIKKANEEAKKGCIVVALLPARTDTKWFHEYIYKKHEIRFLKGRLKFVGAEHSAPFPSMIVVFKC